MADTGEVQAGLRECLTDEEVVTRVLAGETVFLK